MVYMMRYIYSTLCPSLVYFACTADWIHVVSVGILIVLILSWNFEIRACTYRLTAEFCWQIIVRRKLCYRKDGIIRYSIVSLFMSCFNNVCAIGHTCCVKFHQSAKNNLQDQVCSVLTALMSNCCTADPCRWHEIFLFLTCIISEHLKYFLPVILNRKKKCIKIRFSLNNSSLVFP